MRPCGEREREKERTLGRKKILVSLGAKIPITFRS